MWPVRPLNVTAGPLQGLFLIDLEVHEDPERPGASFREVFHAQAMAARGLPAFEPVQFNVSESREGTLRGIHAEPWEKLVHVVAGEVFAAVADLRQDSPTAGEVWTGRLDRERAVFLTRGLGNAFQATSDLAIYTYLVNAHREPGTRYPAVRWDDADLAIDWPILDQRLRLSEKDQTNPTLRQLWAGES